MKHLNTFSNQQTFLSIKKVCLTWQSMQCVIEVQCFIVPCHKITPPFNIFVFCKDKTGVMWSIRIFSLKIDTTISEYLFSSEGHCLKKQLEGWKETELCSHRKVCRSDVYVSQTMNTMSRHYIDMKSSDDDDEFPWLQDRKCHLMTK